MEIPLVFISRDGTQFSRGLGYHARYVDVFVHFNIQMKVDYTV